MVVYNCGMDYHGGALQVGHGGCDEVIGTINIDGSLQLRHGL